MEIQTLSQFIDVMNDTVEIRKKLAEIYLTNREVDINSLEQLITFLKSVEQIPNQNGYKLLQLTDAEVMKADVNYEVEELRKDIWFFKDGEERFTEHLRNIHSNYQEQVNQGVEFLKDVNFLNFITDRDGTVNNYCGRYSTSVQSAYNAVYLSRFASAKVKKAIILTSAPLQNPGLLDINVNPENIFIYAGSKGREFAAQDGTKGNFPIEEHKQKMLDKLNQKLTRLVAEKDYADFARIGSGLQYKFGQTTIARQDINHSIDKKRSEDFLKKIKELVSDTDSQNEYFKIEDTGLDIEIILTVEDKDSGKTRDFDKGDGISFLDEKLSLDLQKGPNLICGDTYSDVPMVTAAMKKSKNTYTVFVTKDEKLKDKVRGACPNQYFVSEPDILISILNKLALS